MSGSSTPYPPAIDIPAGTRAPAPPALSAGRHNDHGASHGHNEGRSRQGLPSTGAAPKASSPVEAVWRPTSLPRACTVPAGCGVTSSTVHRYGGGRNRQGLWVVAAHPRIRASALMSSRPHPRIRIHASASTHPHLHPRIPPHLYPRGSSHSAFTVPTPARASSLQLSGGRRERGGGREGRRAAGRRAEGDCWDYVRK